MKNRTQENIRATFNKMHKIAEAYIGEPLEIIDTYNPALKGAHPLQGLSYALGLMQDADYYVGPSDPYMWPGCYLEGEAFARYKNVHNMIRVDIAIIAPDALEVIHKYTTAESKNL